MQSQLVDDSIIAKTKSNRHGLDPIWHVHCGCGRGDLHTLWVRQGGPTHTVFRQSGFMQGSGDD